ncbi:MAG: N-acetylneuraminate synthase family protein [Sulfuricurvum sp.]|nr:N-acetylneuraminate synthase family protein [Sulfuricurvum sp.]MDP3023102.1 N-acetylneuraminate synthase family protein [Sulfuricurvum sp.]
MYIIAEIGINYNGSLENCYKMIDVAKKSGCQAAKFQLFSAKSLYPQSAGKLDWKDADKTYSYNIYDAVQKFELPLEWIDELMNYCERLDIDFLASVFDLEGLNFMVEKGMKVIKLSSYTITHIPLIEAAAKTGLPIIMSTGGATLTETEEAVRTVQKYHNDLTLLHCSIQYPTELKDTHMGVLDTFSKAFPSVKYGYSDHTKEPTDAPVQAVYLGATVIEKHITLDKTMEGPDHFFALEPNELNMMCNAVTTAHKAYKNEEYVINPTIYGNSEKICHPHEQYLRDFAYMTLFAKKPISCGTQILSDDLIILRPGKKTRGLDPKYLDLFKKFTVIAKKDLHFEDPITWHAILG